MNNTIYFSYITKVKLLYNLYEYSESEYIIAILVYILYCSYIV